MLIEIIFRTGVGYNRGLLSTSGEGAQASAEDEESTHRSKASAKRGNNFFPKSIIESLRRMDKYLSS